MFLISICAVVMFAAFAVVSIRWSSNALKSAIEDKTYYEASKCANQMSMVFENAEGTIDALAAEVLHGFNVHALKRDRSYLDDYMKELSPVIQSALTDVEDAAGLYFTFDPQLSNYQGTYEIWYSLDEKGRSVYTDATENGIYLEAFSYLDAPHMQYYFRSVEKPMLGIWTDPGYDPDIGKEVLTYSKSVYVDGTLIGVLGADIFTDHTTDIIDKMDVENKGNVFLLNDKNKQIVASAKVDAQEIWKDFGACLTEKNSGIIHTSLGGVAFLVSFSKLSNDWTLAMVNEEDELFAPINFIKALIIVLSVILALLTIAVTYFALNRFANPVKKAAELLRMMELEEHVEPEEERRVQSEEDIEALVRKQIEKQREQDLLLAHQSRLAQAGEMLAGIAHQWKQPLNKINILLGNLRDARQYGELTDEELEQTVKRSEEIIKSMSTTIDDFRSYLKPDKKQEDFPVMRAINAVLTLLEERLKLSGIEVFVECETDYHAYGFKNALYHIVLNVIDNAIEAIEDSRPKNRLIQISVKREGEMVEINIFNTGDKISEEMKGRLFSPYSTTKEENGGSGLGLAISKSLVETSMGGSICLHNAEGGVNCRILVRESEDGK